MDSVCTESYKWEIESDDINAITWTDIIYKLANNILRIAAGKPVDGCPLFINSMCAPDEFSSIIASLPDGYDKIMER